MRYYELDENGFVLGSYANPQEGMTLVLLPAGGTMGWRWDAENEVWIEPPPPPEMTICPTCGGSGVVPLEEE